MDERSANIFSGIEMDKKAMPAYHSGDGDCTPDGQASQLTDLKSAPTSNSTDGQSEKKSTTTRKKRSSSLAANGTTCNYSILTRSAAKRIANPQASRDKSPIQKKAATTKDQKVVTTKDKMVATTKDKKAATRKDNKIAAMKDKEPRKPSKESGVKKRNMKTAAKSTKKKQ